MFALSYYTCSHIKRTAHSLTYISIMSLGKSILASINTEIVAICMWNAHLKICRYIICHKHWERTKKKIMFFSSFRLLPFRSCALYIFCTENEACKFQREKKCSYMYNNRCSLIEIRNEKCHSAKMPFVIIIKSNGSWFPRKIFCSNRSTASMRP